MSRSDLTNAIRRQLNDLPIDEYAGEREEPPHVELFLLRGGASIADVLDDDDLEDDDFRFLESCDGGLIVVLLQDGTYSVRYFEDEDDIEDRWADLISDLAGGTKPEELRALGDDEGDERRTARGPDDDDEDAEELDDEEE